MLDFSNFPPIVKKAAGILILLIGLFFFGLLIRNTVRDFPIWFFGESATGVVEEKWYELISSENSNEFAANYFLSYSFKDAEGKRLTGSTSFSALEWGGFVEGDPIPIIYSSLNPKNNRVDDSRFLPLMLCSYIPFIFIVWFCLTTGYNILSAEFIKPKEEIKTLEN